MSFPAAASTGSPPRAELDAFLQDQEQQSGGELSVDESPQPGRTAGTRKTATPINCTSPNCTKCARSTPACVNWLRSASTSSRLIPQERTGVEEPRYVLRRGDNDIPLEDLRGLLAAVREAGEKGLKVTRFKGLGEMNAEELRDTTLDPANRTLVQVSMQDAGAADEMFRVLMGDKVEPRREFIEKHALEVRNLDV